MWLSAQISLTNMPQSTWGQQTLQGPASCSSYVTPYGGGMETEVEELVAGATWWQLCHFLWVSP